MYCPHNSHSHTAGTQRIYTQTYTEPTHAPTEFTYTHTHTHTADAQISHTYAEGINTEHTHMHTLQTITENSHTHITDMCTGLIRYPGTHPQQT